MLESRPAHTCPVGLRYSEKSELASARKCCSEAMLSAYQGFAVQRKVRAAVDDVPLDDMIVESSFHKTLHENK
jgi:hypothetical protein